MLFDQEGCFSPDSLKDPRAVKALFAAAERTDSKIRVGDLLDGILAQGAAGDAIVSLIKPALPRGTQVKNIRELITVASPPLQAGVDSTFDGEKGSFTAEALAVIDSFEKELQSVSEDSKNFALEQLTICVLTHLDENLRTFSQINVDVAVDLLRKHIEIRSKPSRPLFDETSGRLLSEELSHDGRSVIEEAARVAGELGADHILPPHLFLALLGETEGLLEQLIRVQSKPGSGIGRVREHIVATFGSQGRRETSVELDRDGMGATMVCLLEDAARESQLAGSDEIDSNHLLVALLRQPSPLLASALGGSALGFDLGKMLADVEKKLRTGEAKSARDTAYRLPAGLLPSEDLTYNARKSRITPAIGFEEHFDALERALYRKESGNVLIVGPGGIGKTSLMRELARRAAEGKIKFLKRKRFLRADCGNVTPNESAGKLLSLISHLSDRTDVILCVDELGSLIRSTDTGANKVALRSALQNNRIRLIGTLHNSDFDDLFASDHEILQLFTPVIMEEPPVDVALQIVAQEAKQLEMDFHLEISADAIDRAVVLPAEYLMNERLPKKSLKVLRRVCEDVDFERTQRSATIDAVSPSHIIRVVSELSGVPEETLAGVTDSADYEVELGRMVLGQDEAVDAMAADLRAIKAGRKRPGGGPASVVLFAGLTGTGKTELAKAVAKLYSSSKRLQTYTMGNFTEPHSVAGLIGSPVGYHGHDQGGPLINALNSDPYGVFLLDEAEKAHPNVWKPFLNLFDEGWIVDQRGVKGFADRSIFILTSNAGSEIVSRMTVEKRPLEEIIEKVKEALSKVRSPNGNEVVFPPEFLARLDRIIVFRPLDEAVMRGITSLAVEKLNKNYVERLDKSLKIDKALIKRIGRLAHETNVRAAGKEGGRVANRFVSQYIADEIQKAERKQQEAYAASNVIDIGLDPLHPGGDSEPPNVSVEFREEPPPTIRQRLERNSKELRSWLQSQSASTVPQRLAMRIDSLKAELQSAEAGIDTCALDSALERLAEAASRTMGESEEIVETIQKATAGLGGGTQ